MKLKHLKMFKNLLIVLLVLCQFRGHTFQYAKEDAYTEHTVSEGDIMQILPISQTLSKESINNITEMMQRTPIVIHMRGQNNIYHVDQQTIVMRNAQDFKRLFPNNRCDNDVNNESDKSNCNNDKNNIFISRGYRITPEIGAHKLHLPNTPWGKARQICIQEGGNLAVINSESEKKVLRKMLEETALNRAWIGLHDLFLEGDWVTVNGDSFVPTEYIKWATKDIMGDFGDQPDNLLGNQNCASFMIQGALDDEDCNRLNSFFCEISV